MKSHLELEIKILQNARTDADDNLERILKSKETFIVIKDVIAPTPPSIAAAAIATK
jgi:hypothetical protein